MPVSSVKACWRRWIRWIESKSQTIGLPLQSIGTPRSAVQKQLNRSRCHLGCGLTLAQESVVRWVHMGTTWQLSLNRLCITLWSLLSNYFDHLFNILHHSHWDDRCRPRLPPYPRNKCLSYEFIIRKIANILHYGSWCHGEIAQK